LKDDCVHLVVFKDLSGQQHVELYILLKMMEKNTKNRLFQDHLDEFFWVEFFQIIIALSHADV
jgi:hypothetical protein